MDEFDQREEALFEAALQLPEAERAAYVIEKCGEDTRLRQRLETLLAAFQRASSFMSEPALSTPAAFGFNSVISEKPGDRIGRFRLLEKIGEGGCGVVYMAEQEEPVRRRVALKIIKLGMDTREVVARFEAERQALAMMDHANIAKVLDAGATETGRPYFVMELVQGTRMTEFCDERGFSTEQRLRLFIKVCQAVQHAHQKGIIHRDLKPSNILVTVNDGAPVPKVIDFGIAKATTGRLTDKTLFTAFEQFIGTPAYMSPEQTEMTKFDIDTRSDIYSLGVLLYELLTGRTPFDQKELLAAGLAAMLRTIREQEPKRPSTRLGAMPPADLTETARRRQTDPPKLLHLLRGDLDWIVMKALEKDRARRYETAHGLASDIRRHLNCEPVIARPPSKLYEFQKTVRRHWFGFAATAALIAVLSLAVLVSWRAAVRARRAEAREADHRSRAEAEAARNQKVAELMSALVEPKMTIRDLQDDLSKADPAVLTLNRVGELLREQGKFEQAEAALRQAAALAKNQRDRALLLLRLSQTFRAGFKMAEAESAAREALKADKYWYRSRYDLGGLLLEQGKFPEAAAVLREGLEVTASPGERSVMLQRLGPVLRAQGKIEEAAKLEKEGAALREIYRENPALAVTTAGVSIPPRDLQCSTNCIDLSPCYNATLDENWHNRRARFTGQDLSTLATGQRTYAGVDFDVRGIVQLAGRGLNGLNPGYPEAVSQIRIDRPCARLHFLHSLGWGRQVRRGTHIASYVIHYTDGQEAEIKLNAQEHLDEWSMADAAQDLPKAKVAWTGENTRGATLNLFLFTWENPRSDAVIEYLDFRSTMTEASAFLIAITAE